MISERFTSGQIGRVSRETSWLFESTVRLNLNGLLQNL